MAPTATDGRAQWNVTAQPRRMNLVLLVDVRIAVACRRALQPGDEVALTEMAHDVNVP